MQNIVNDIESGGGVIVYKTPFAHAELIPHGFEIRIDGAEPAMVHAQHLIDAAGLDSVGVAKNIKGLTITIFHKRATQKATTMLKWAKSCSSV